MYYPGTGCYRLLPSHVNIQQLQVAADNATLKNSVMRTTYLTSTKKFNETQTGNIHLENYRWSTSCFSSSQQSITAKLLPIHVLKSENHWNLANGSTATMNVNEINTWRKSVPRSWFVHDIRYRPFSPATDLRSIKKIIENSRTSEFNEKFQQIYRRETECCAIYICR